MAKDPDLTILARPIETDEDANAALHLLSWIKTATAAALAKAEQAITQAKAKALETCRLIVDEQTWSYDEAFRHVEQKLLDFAKAQRARLFSQKKTYPLMFGQLKSRKKHDSLRVAEGVTEEQVIERLEKLDASYVRTAKSIDFTAVKLALEKQQLTPAQMKKLGLEFTKGEDELSVHPSTA